MKYLHLSFIALLFIACNSNDNNTESTTENLDNSNEIVTTDKELETTESDDAFTYLEDYIRIETKKELEETFGKENLKNGSSWYAEGTVEIQHTVLTNPTNDHIIKFLYDQDDENLISSIEVFHFIYNDDYEITGTQKVESKSGIYSGMTLNELVKWNGKDISFSGFGWDYAGGIMSNNGGKLKDSEVGIRLDIDLEGSDFDAYSSLFGDMELFSSEELVKDAPIIVQELTLYKER